MGYEGRGPSWIQVLFALYWEGKGREGTSLGGTPNPSFMKEISTLEMPMWEREERIQLEKYVENQPNLCCFIF
ncbi:hypothetical protein ACRRTK_023861 [Alexandromys fortis]